MLLDLLLEVSHINCFIDVTTYAYLNGLQLNLLRVAKFTNPFKWIFVTYFDCSLLNTLRIGGHEKPPQRNQKTVLLHPAPDLQVRYVNTILVFNIVCCNYIQIVNKMYDNMLFQLRVEN